MLDFSIVATIVTWAPLIGHILVLVLIFGLYRRRAEIGERYPSLLSAVGWVSVSFRAVYLGIISLIQYWLWSRDKIGSILLDLPIKKAGDFSIFQNRLGYFGLYLFEHYWLNFLLSIGLALAFFFFLKILQKYRGRFFDTGETALGGIFAFLAGWPNGFAFIGLSFVLVVVIAVFRLIRQRGKFTTLGLPFLVAGGLTLLFGDVIALWTGLSPLII